MRVARRSSNDKEWQAVKDKVFSRDKNDRILRVLTMQEAILLKKNAGRFLNILDPAHYIAVSERPDLCYKSYNIVVLNRYSHDNLDRFRDPITAEPITKEDVQKWWERILKGDSVQYNYLKSKNLV